MEKENVKSPIQQEDIIEEKLKVEMPDVHVIRERPGVCSMCGKDRDLRFGWCWDCAEAQNILSIGKTMMEDESEGDYEVPVKIINERLKKLIEKGWGTGIDKKI